MTIVSDFTAVISGSSWWGQTSADSTLLSRPSFISYSFDTTLSSHISLDVSYNQAFKNSFHAFSSAQQDIARQALQQWANVSGVTFFEVAAGIGDIRFGAYNFSADATQAAYAGLGYYPVVSLSPTFPYEYSSDILIDNSWVNTAILLHEIGHAIGLKHPFDGDPTLTTSLDNQSQTVMSYTGANSSVLGPLDIQAVQYLYGTADRDGSQVAAWAWNAGSATLAQAGTLGGDKVRGFNTHDEIYGGLGNDYVFSAEGNDFVDAGSGADTVFGGGGGDQIYGFEGNDSLNGDDGADSLTGGLGNDTITGGAGLDFAFFSSARAAYAITNYGTYVDVTGPDGHDLLYGVEYLQFAEGTYTAAGLVNNTLFAASIPAGLATNDSIYGGAGNDQQSGGDGADILVGLGGNDTGYGGNGNDYFYGGDGNDYFMGGAGVDVLVGGTGNDVAYGGDEQDYLYGGDGNDVLAGDGGVDVLIGEAGNDSLYGGDGGDYFYGGIGNNSGFGDAGNDIFVMDTGNDVADGGDGQDYFYMGEGNDTMYGGDGVDVLLGQGGSDTFDGGTGIDYLFLGSGGSDVVLFNINSGIDVVNDFQPGIDRVVLQATGLASFSDFTGKLYDYGSFTIISVSSSSAIWLIGVTPGQLSAADFTFS